MAIFLLIFLAICLVLLGIGAVLAVLGVLVLGVLVGVGMVSVSALIGAADRKLSTGFQALFLMAGIAGGMFGGMVVGVGAVIFFDPAMGMGLVVAAGAAAGLLVGSGVALLFNFAWRRVMGVWMERRGGLAYPVVWAEKSGARSKKFRS